MSVSLSLQGISLSQRLDAVNAQTNSAQVVHLLGPNGSGKSSLLSVISGLVAADSGSIQINNKDIKNYDLIELSNFRALLEQSQHSTFSLTVKESLAFYQQFSDIPQTLETALEINTFLTRPMNTLSGGEQQRVHIARALMPIWSVIQKGEGLVLLDEPFQGLDFKHQHLLCQLLKSLSDLGNLVIVSQHDLNLSERYADSVWLMKDGQLKAAGDSKTVLIPDQIKEIFECTIDIAIDKNGRRFFSSSL